MGPLIAGRALIEYELPAYASCVRLSANVISDADSSETIEPMTDRARSKPL